VEGLRSGGRLSGAERGALAEALLAVAGPSGRAVHTVPPVRPVRPGFRPGPCERWMIPRLEEAPGFRPGLCVAAVCSHFTRTHPPPPLTPPYHSVPMCTPLMTGPQRVRDVLRWLLEPVQRRWVPSPGQVSPELLQLATMSEMYKGEGGGGVAGLSLKHWELFHDAQLAERCLRRSGGDMVGRCTLTTIAPGLTALGISNRPISVYLFPRRALTLCPQLCMGIQPGARFPARSADALPATLYGQFTQAIYRNQPIQLKL